MKKIITIVLIALICLVVGTISFLFLTGSGFSQDAQKEVEGKKEIVNEYKNAVFYNPGASIITNIKESSRYLKVAVALEIKDEKAKVYYEKNEYKIKDVIIGVLRNKSEPELIQPDSQEHLKDEMKKVLSEKIDTKDLINLYFNEFVIQ